MGRKQEAPKAAADSWWSRADSPHLGGDCHVLGWSVLLRHSQTSLPKNTSEHELWLVEGESTIKEKSGVQSRFDHLLAM